MPSPAPLTGLHHVTAICSDADRTIHFYTDILGLRLAKLTVNFDDPFSYHFYLTDDEGRPGTTLTFFAWPNAGQGRAGVGQLMSVGFTIPLESLHFWVERLAHKHVPHELPVKRFDETVLRLRDPDGMLVEIVAHPKGAQKKGWEGGGIPAEHSLRALHNVVLLEDGYELTAKLLTETLGFREVNQAATLYRYEIGNGGPGTFVDLYSAPDFLEGRLGTGTLHHVAFGVKDDDAEKQWRDHIIASGYNPSPVIDRFYFHSVYFHEPGGVLFELATMQPGFQIDQDYKTLGTEFTLPPMYRNRHDEIVKHLPKVLMPPFPRPTT